LAFARPVNAAPVRRKPDETLSGFVDPGEELGTASMLGLDTLVVVTSNPPEPDQKARPRADGTGWSGQTKTVSATTKIAQSQRFGGMMRAPSRCGN
jgi:hypothetical protein